jgi:transcriptional regulator with XRE-family HTH domain
MHVLYWRATHNMWKGRIVTDAPSPAADAQIARNVRTLREQRGWSQGELAKRITEAGLPGFHQTTIARIETIGDKHRPLRLSEAATFASVLGTSVERFLQASGATAGWIDHAHAVARGFQALQHRTLELASDLTDARLDLDGLLERIPEPDNTFDEMLIAAARAAIDPWVDRDFARYLGVQAAVREHYRREQRTAGLRADEFLDADFEASDFEASDG